MVEVAGTSEADVRLVLGGDVNVAREAPTEAFRGIEPVLAATDLRFCNLEGLLAIPSEDPGRPDILHKPNWRHSPPEMAAALVAAGIDVVSCANNVSFPPQAVMASLAVLDAHGVQHCGAGGTRAEARRPIVVERKGTRVGFLAYTSIYFPRGHAATDECPGVATLKAHTSYQPDPRVAEVPGRPPLVRTAPDRCELVAFLEDVRRLRLEVDLLVVSLHWGVAGDYVCEYQRTIAHAAIDAGADVIAGHGPHSVHGVEVHQGRPILYSLGNLVFDWPTMRGRHRDGLVAVLTIANKQLTGVTLQLVQRDEGNDVRLVSLTEPAGAALLDRLTALSRQLGCSLSAAEGRVVVAGVR